MNSRTKLNTLQRIMAVVGTTSAAALMTLPVLAQSNSNNGVLNPSPSIFNEAPYNRSTTSGVGNTNTIQTPGTQVPGAQSSDRCAPNVQGGVGGPIDQSSQGVTSNQQGLGSYSSSSDLAAVPGSTNSYPNQSESYANQRDRGITSGQQTVQSQQTNQTVIGAGNMSSSNLNSANVNRRQFDGNNREAAIAYRSNGPAATAGHEAKMNLDEYQQRDESSVPVSSNTVPYSSQSSTSSNLSASPLPTECAPR